MKALQNFVTKLNTWNGMFGYAPLDLSKAKDRQAIADELDMRLSPENLSCDGELSISQVRARYKEFTTVAAQLQKLDPTVKFSEYA